LAQALYRAGERLEALATLGVARQRLSGDKAVEKEFAAALARNGELEEAAGLLEGLREASPRDIYIVFLLVRCFSEMGQEKEAKRAARYADDIEDERFTIPIKVEVLMAGGHYEQALGVLVTCRRTTYILLDSSVKST